jgi:hypothetical protein
MYIMMNPSLYVYSDYPYHIGTVASKKSHRIVPSMIEYNSMIE